MGSGGHRLVALHIHVWLVSCSVLVGSGHLQPGERASPSQAPGLGVDPWQALLPGCMHSKVHCDFSCIIWDAQGS